MPGLLWDIRVAGVFRLPKVQRRVKAFFASAPVQPRRWHEPAAGPHQEPRTPRPPPGPEPPIFAALPHPGHTQLVRAGEGRCPLLTMPYRDKKLGRALNALPKNFKSGAGLPSSPPESVFFWRRRADSNRRIEVLQTSALVHLATSPYNCVSWAGWCRGRDLNPHELTPTAPSRPRVYLIPPPRPFDACLFYHNCLV